MPYRSLWARAIEAVDQWRKSIGAVAVLCCVVLFGCAPAGPDYQPPVPKVPGQWQELDQQSFTVDLPRTTRWWTLLQDPMLDSLIGRAFKANPNLRIAEANIREARAQRVIAGAAGSLDAGAAATYSRRSANSSSGGNHDLYQLGFDAAWELDVFGRIRRAVEAADAGLGASQEDLHYVQVSLAAEVVRNYLELRGGQMQLATTWSNIRSQQKTVDLVKGRFEVGLGNELDLVQAQTQLALINALVPALEKSIRESIHQLALLLGETPESLLAELSPPADLPVIPGLLTIDLPSSLLRQRADVRAAERRVAMATAGIGVATAELFPSFSLLGLLGLQSSGLSQLVASGSRYWSVGPVINLNLFDQGTARAGIEINKARRDSALAAYEQTVLTALTEVEDALVAFAKEKNTLEILRQAVVSGKKAVRMSNGLYETGLVDFLSVLQSERALYQSEDQLVLSRQRLGLAMVSIYKALGGGWQPRSQDMAGADRDSVPPAVKSTLVQ